MEYANYLYRAAEAVDDDPGCAGDDQLASFGDSADTSHAGVFGQLADGGAHPLTALRAASGFSSAI